MEKPNDADVVKPNILEQNSLPQIPSAGESSSGKINRLRGISSNVFPEACMGNLNKKSEMQAKSVPASEGFCTSEAGDAAGALPDSKAKLNFQPPTVKRNPLTGEGVLSSDMPRVGAVRKKLEKTKFMY